MEGECINMKIKNILTSLLIILTLFNTFAFSCYAHDENINSQKVVEQRAEHMKASKNISLTKLLSNLEKNGKLSSNGCKKIKDFIELHNKKVEVSLMKKIMVINVAIGAAIGGYINFDINYASFDKKMECLGKFLLRGLILGGLKALVITFPFVC